MKEAAIGLLLLHGALAFVLSSPQLAPEEYKTIEAKYLEYTEHQDQLALKKKTDDPKIVRLSCDAGYYSEHSKRAFHGSSQPLDVWACKLCSVCSFGEVQVRPCLATTDAVCKSCNQIPYVFRKGCKEYNDYMADAYPDLESNLDLEFDMEEMDKINNWGSKILKLRNFDDVTSNDDRNRDESEEESIFADIGEDTKKEEEERVPDDFPSIDDMDLSVKQMTKEEIRLHFNNFDDVIKATFPKRVDSAVPLEPQAEDDDLIAFLASSDESSEEEAPVKKAVKKTLPSILKEEVTEDQLEKEYNTYMKKLGDIDGDDFTDESEKEIAPVKEKKRPFYEEEVTQEDVENEYRDYLIKHGIPLPKKGVFEKDSAEVQDSYEGDDDDDDDDDVETEEEIKDDMYFLLRQKYAGKASRPAENKEPYKLVSVQSSGIKYELVEKMRPKEKRMKELIVEIEPMISQMENVKVKSATKRIESCALWVFAVCCALAAIHYMMAPLLRRRRCAHSLRRPMDAEQQRIIDSTYHRLVESRKNSVDLKHAPVHV